MHNKVQVKHINYNYLDNISIKSFNFTLFTYLNIAIN